VVVLGDAAKSEGCCFLDGWVELFETVDEGVKST